jgi:hypothetical protein
MVTAKKTQSEQARLEEALENALKRNTELEEENQSLRDQSAKQKGGNEYWAERTAILERIVIALSGEPLKKEHSELRKQISEFLMAVAATNAGWERVLLLLPLPEEEKKAAATLAEEASKKLSPEELQALKEKFEQPLTGKATTA